MNIRCRCGLQAESDISGACAVSESFVYVNVSNYYPLFRIRLRGDKKFVLGEEKSDELVSV